MLTKKQIETCLKWRGIAEEMQAELDQVHADASDKLDKRSDKWKESDDGETAQQTVNDLEYARDACETLVQHLSSLPLGE